MKKVIAISLALVGLSNATFMTTQDPWEFCPRSVKCTPEQRLVEDCSHDFTGPVVGVTPEKNYEFFMNPCSACSFEQIYKYYQGSFCDPEKYTEDTMCAEIYKPVCAIYGESGEFREFGNECSACITGQTNFYMEGKCPTLKGTHIQFN